MVLEDRSFTNLYSPVILPPGVLMPISVRLSAYRALQVTTEPSRLATLTVRQRQILAMVADGWTSKTIAFNLGISRRTVENHRYAIMLRTGSQSLPGLMRLVIADPSFQVN